jgi:hypothetical protein
VRLRRARLRHRTGDSQGQFGSNYVSNSDYSLFGNTDTRESPQYPGLVLDVNTDQLVGEAALDVPVNLLQGSKDSTGMSQKVQISSPHDLEVFV